MLFRLKGHIPNSWNLEAMVLGLEYAWPELSISPGRRTVVVQVGGGSPLA